MKTLMTKIASFVLVGTFALGALAFSPAPVYAQDQSPTPQPNHLTRTYDRLTDAYNREQTALGKLSDGLSKAGGAVSHVGDLISKGNAAGLDTSSLTAALSAFQSALSSAQASQSTAAGILSTHNGFDGSGKVTDSVAALNTVTSAGQALKNSASAMKGAGSALKSAVTAWVDANKGYYNGKLEEGLGKLNEWLGVQGTNIGKLNDAAVKLQNFITKAKANGEDTSSLEVVLADLQSKTPQSQSYHDQAVSILGSHAGFDDSGKVTDAKTAAATLKSANEQLTASKDINVGLYNELKSAYDAWKAAHPHTTPVPTVEPTAESTLG